MAVDLFPVLELISRAAVGAIHQLGLGDIQKNPRVVIP